LLEELHVTDVTLQNLMMAVVEVEVGVSRWGRQGET
jgi:hypothetical protein